MGLVRFRPSVKRYHTNNWVDQWLNREFGLPVHHHTPAVNIVEQETNFQVEVVAPGLKKEDFEIKVEKDTLFIGAKVKKEENVTTGKYTQREFSSHSFKRSFYLPETIETKDISASYDNGILTVLLPKKAAATVPPAQTIEVS